MGRSFPLDFEAFGDHKLPGYIYALAPLLSFLPLDMVSIKIPSVIAGLLTIVALYLLTKNITRNKSLSLLVAFLLAISPWPIHLSRMALESNLALASFSWGIYFLIKSFDSKAKKNIKQLVIAGVLLALSTYFYVAYRLVTVLVLLATLFLSFRYQVDKKKLVILFVSFSLAILPLAGELLGTSGTARFSQVSIFSSDGIDATLLEQHNFCFLSQPTILPRICRLIYNKPFLYVKTFSENYLSFLLPTFLFIEGDQLEYLSDPNSAEFYMFLAPFYLVGTYYWLKKKGFRADFIKASFLIAPIPSALAGDPQIVRGSALLIFVALFTATGLYEVLKLLKKQSQQVIYVGLVSLVMVISLARFFISYSYIYPGKYETAFYNLSEEIVDFIAERESAYDTIYIFRQRFPDFHIMLAFYNQLDPLWYQKNVVRPTETDGFGFTHPTKLGKYEFGDDKINDFLCDNSGKTILYITNGVDMAPQWLFKDFSKVHAQAQVFDVSETREQLKKAELLQVICP